MKTIMVTLLFLTVTALASCSPDNDGGNLYTLRDRVEDFKHINKEPYNVIEEFCHASKYEIQNEPVESNIVPGIFVDVAPGFICPADNTIILKERPNHGEPFTCGGHTFVIHGNCVGIIE